MRQKSAKFTPTRSRWGNARGVLRRPQHSILSTCPRQRRLPLVPNGEHQKECALMACAGLAQALPSTAKLVSSQMFAVSSSTEPLFSVLLQLG